MREVFGGLEACGVFASILSSFVLFLVLYFVLFLVLLLLCLPFFLSSLLLLLSLFLPSLLVLLSLACPLGCLASALGLVLSLFVGRCCFFFPFGIYAKRKGAPCWCVLSCPVVVALVVIPSLQFFRLLLCTPSLQHCKPVQSSYTIRYRCHRSKQM